MPTPDEAAMTDEQRMFSTPSDRLTRADPEEEAQLDAAVEDQGAAVVLEIDDLDELLRDLYIEAPEATEATEREAAQAREANTRISASDDLVLATLAEFVSKHPKLGPRPLYKKFNRFGLVSRFWITLPDGHATSAYTGHIDRSSISALRESCARAAEGAAALVRTPCGMCGGSWPMLCPACSETRPVP